MFWPPYPCPPSFAEQPESSLPVASEATVAALPCSVTTLVFSVAHSYQSEHQMLTRQKSYPEVCTG